MPEPMSHPTEPGLVATADRHPLFGDLDAKFRLPKCRPMAVLSLELDGVRAVTWASGPVTGEELLRIVAGRLTDALAVDDMLDHLDGGKFACLLTGLPDRERLCHVAWKLLATAATPVALGRFRFTLHPWIGIALWPADGATYASLFRSARAAMYRARHQKSGYAFFDESADVWDDDD
jgi:diguanylate cyclase